jgi:hypothetical protein
MLFDGPCTYPPRRDPQPDKFILVERETFQGQAYSRGKSGLERHKKDNAKIAIFNTFLDFPVGSFRQIGRVNRIRGFHSPFL